MAVFLVSLTLSSLRPRPSLFRNEGQFSTLDFFIGTADCTVRERESQFEHRGAIRAREGGGRGNKKLFASFFSFDTSEIAFVFFFFFFFFLVGYKQPKRTQNEDTSAPHSVFQHALMTHYIAKEPLVARRRKLTRLIALLLTMLFLLLIDQVFLSLDRHATTSSGVVVAVGVRPSLPEKDRLLGCSPALVLAASAARFELCQRCWW